MICQLTCRFFFCFFKEAITVDEKLTPLGYALSRLPVDISIGKMLLMGCVFQQLQPILTMTAALSVQTPFTNRAYRDPECEVLSQRTISFQVQIFIDIFFYRKLAKT